MPPPLLSAADSFNSSGATIVPEPPTTRARTRLNHSTARTDPGTGNGNRDGRDLAAAPVPSFISDARMLMPSDSLGRELDAALASGGLGGGDDGHSQGQGRDWDGEFREFLDNSNTQTSTQSSGSSQLPPRELSFSQFLYQPPDTSSTGPAVDFLNLNLNLAQQYDLPPTPFSLQNEPYRPSSALSSLASSHHTNSGNVESDYSYSTTDIDDDSIMSDSISVHSTGLSGLDGNVHNLNIGQAEAGNRRGSVNVNVGGLWNPPPLGHGGLAHWERGGTAASESVSPPDILSPGISPLELQAGHGRGVPGKGAGGGGGEDEIKRVDRLEHRRQINRKSAQKHRARRKDELETLTRQISERDAKIAQLERDLAVERAKFSQLVGIVRSKGVGLAID